MYKAFKSQPNDLEFQFHKGSINTSETLNVDQSLFSCFNSIKVRLIQWN